MALTSNGCQLTISTAKPNRSGKVPARGDHDSSKTSAGRFDSVNRQRGRRYLEPTLWKTYAEFVILAISLLIGFGVSAFSMAVALCIFSVISDLDRGD